MEGSMLHVPDHPTQVLQSETLIIQNYTKALRDVDIRSLVSYLSDEDILNQLEMEQLASLDGSQYDVEYLARVLAEKGASMFTTIKQKIRRFRKSQVSEHSAADSKGIPKHGMLNKSVFAGHTAQRLLGMEYAEMGLEHDQKGGEHAETGHRSEKGKLTITSQMETFSVLFYTFAVKTIHMLNSSLDALKKPKWLRADVAIEEFPKFFPDNSLSDLHDVTDELITVSLTTLLDSFQQLHYKHHRLVQENKALREGKLAKHPSPHRKGHHHSTKPDHCHAECRREVSQLKKEISVLVREKQQTVDVTQQWSIQCHELEKQIEELTHQLATKPSSSGTLRTNCTTGVSRGDRPLLKARDSASDEETEESVPSSDVKRKLEFEVATLRRKLSKANSRVSTLEVKLQESVGHVSYYKVLQEKTDAENQLQQNTIKLKEFTEKIQALESEQQALQKTNEALLEDMSTLRNEAEDDKNYIEELKDQIGNYKLNARLKEPSTREMARLLQTNRDLEEKLREQHYGLDMAKEEKAQALERVRQLEGDIRKHLERRSLLEKQLREAKDELFAYKTHVKEISVATKGVSQCSSALDSQPSKKLGTDVCSEDLGRILSQHQANDGPLLNGHVGLGNKEVFTPPSFLSFQSRERKCPVCEQVFLKLTQHEFTTHVAGCFK